MSARAGSAVTSAWFRTASPCRSQWLSATGRPSACCCRCAHLSPANAAGAALALGASVAHALGRPKGPTDHKIQDKQQLKWWVLTGSNRRHSPCKGGLAGQLRKQAICRDCNCLILLVVYRSKTEWLDGRCDRRAQLSIRRSRESPAELHNCLSRDYREVAPLRDAFVIFPASSKLRSGNSMS
jgi:hypothetical protein